MIVARPLQAETPQAFVIESANSQLDDSVYFLNAVFAINLPDYIVTAVEKGFDLPLVMEVEAYREKSMWFDRRIVLIKQQYRISYHALLDEFSILDMNSGIRNYYLSFEKAMERLSVLMKYPALDRNSLLSGKSHTVRIRLGIDDAELPIPLKSSSLWKKDWDLKSDWYEWDLEP